MAVVSALIMAGVVIFLLWPRKPAHDVRGFCHARDCTSPGCGYQIDPMMLTDTSGTTPVHREPT